MRSFVLYLLACLFLISCKKGSSQPIAILLPVTNLPQFELAWQDDFNGSQLNTIEWYHRMPGTRHDGYNDTTTVSTDGAGNLLVKVYSDTIAGAITHHTGMIATRKEYLYGKFEARIAFNNQSGSWSAFWMQSTTMGNPVGNPRLAGMEIDVVETLNHDGRVHHNLHWDGYGASHKQAGFITADLGANNGDYHLYTVEWTPGYYKFYVDAQLTWTYSSTVSQKAEFMILSSEVKNYALNSWAGPINPGGFGSKQNSTTIAKVDYVKYYRLK